MEAVVVQEINKFLKIVFVGIATSVFCYFVIKQIPKGHLRLISLIPFICFFFYAPLTLKCLHFISIFYFAFTWLGTLKLILFAFNKGPIGDPSLPLKHFIILSCFPISINPSQNPSQKGLKSLLNYITKALIFAFIVKCYDNIQFFPRMLVLAGLCCYLYLFLELSLAMSAYPARAILGSEIEPQFQDPYFSTSMHDFWACRWNLMVPAILRPAVSWPIRDLLTPHLGRRWAAVTAVYSAFVVSGFMHEVLYYYLTRSKPTWEVLCFFLLHGVCFVVESFVKRAAGGRWRLHPAIRRVLTVGFIAMTAVWLMLPQVERNEIMPKGIKEYKILLNLVKELGAMVVPWMTYSS